MLDHHQIARADPFSYTVHGKPWTNLEWLSEILMAPVWRAGGWSALVLMFGLAVGALTWILGSELARRLKPLSWACALVLALACTTQSWLARPHLLALPILALWTVQLMHARERNRAPPLWLLPVMTVWANLHGSFLLGLLLIAPFAAEALMEETADRMKVTEKGDVVRFEDNVVMHLIMDHPLTTTPASEEPAPPPPPVATERPRARAHKRGHTSSNTK